MAGDWFIAPTGGNSSIVDFDTCLGIRYKKGSGLPIKPVEKGSFFTANKWMWPFQVVVEMAKSSRDNSGSDLIQFMKDLEELLATVELVDVVTPYGVFKSANIFDLEYRFDNDETGVGMVVPVLTIQEVRIINTSVSTTDISQAGAKNADSVTTKDNGQVSAQQPSQQVSQAVQAGLGRSP